MLTSRAMAGSANEQFTREVCVDERIQELTLDSDEEELGGVLTDSSASEVEVDSKWISGRRQNVAQPFTNRLNHLNTEWMDITEEFTTSAGQLSLGELMQLTNFRLFDAMTAVELMDPKMDANYQWFKPNRQPVCVNALIQSGKLKMSGHSIPKLVGIFDEILCHITSWLNGNTLAQTVYTCFYLLEPTKVEDLHLRAFSLCFSKMTQHLRRVIASSKVYAEDDQQTINYGFSLVCAGVTEQAVLAALKESEDKLQHIVKQFTQIVHEEDSQNKEDLEHTKALLNRIKFLRSFYHSLVLLDKRTLSDLEKADLKLSQAMPLLQSVLETQSIGKEYDAENPIDMGFYPCVNQHLLPPSPRHPEPVSRKVSVEYIQEVITSLRRVLSFAHKKSLREILVSVRSFTNNVDECPSVLPRSYFVYLALNYKGKFFSHISLKPLIKEDLRLFTNPACLNPKTSVAGNSQASEAADSFLIKASPVILDWLNVYGYHRSTHRQRMTQTLEFFADLQIQADHMDKLLHNISEKTNPGSERPNVSAFGCWVLNYLVQVMMEYLQIGFELKLYSPFEHHYIFWYIEYLLGWRHTCLKSAKHFHSIEATLLNKGKKKGKAKAKAMRAPIKELDREENYVLVERLLCLGLVQELDGLRMANKLPYPMFEWFTPPRSFAKRFSVFSPVATPQLIPYQTYHKLCSDSTAKMTSSLMFTAAGKQFDSVKATLDSQGNIASDAQQLLTVAKTNMVITKLSAQGHKKGSKLPPDFDFSAHKHFPIIRIK